MVVLYVNCTDGFPQGELNLDVNTTTKSWFSHWQLRGSSSV